jgi:DNA-binding NtrC family response regulator
MRLAQLFGGSGGRPRERSTASGGDPDVCVLEDDPTAAELAIAICREHGLDAAAFGSPSPFLAALGARPPKLVVLDWQLERELGAAAFLGIRHRLGHVPILCWTGTPRQLLPRMVASDPRTRIVDKSAGLDAFESALGWAMRHTAPRGRRQGTSRS